MQPEVSQSDIALKIWAWALANQKRLIQAGVVLAIAAFVIYLYLNYQESKEVAAGEALSQVLPIRLRDTPPPADLAQSYLKVAQAHSGTRAARHAGLRAAAALFADGKYPEAQAQFEGFLRDDPGSPFAPQAAYGIAVSLDAAGKNAEALAKYDEVAKRYSTDGVAEDAKLAMAALYVAQNKPEMAYKIFDEIMQSPRGNAAAQEAFMRREELAQQFPYLRSNTPPAKTSVSTLMTNALNSVATISTQTVIKASNAMKQVVGNTNRPAPAANSTAPVKP